MTSNKYKLGELIRHDDRRNEDGLFAVADVKGISIQKHFIETKADIKGVSLTPYKLVVPDSFAYVTITSRNGEKITLAHNNSANTYIVSSSYEVFSVERKDLLDSEYLFMFFNRPEFDRYARFNSWGSAREAFSWEEMCDIDIALPPLEVQQKYVNTYKAMIANQQSYERGLDDLKQLCDLYIENLRRSTDLKQLGSYLIECDQRNIDNISTEYVRGLSTNKEMIPTKANMRGVNVSNYKVVKPGQIAYVSDTSRRGDKISIGFNDTGETFLVSSISTVFETKTERLLPKYLMLFLTRTEFDRYARFHSWGSARETFDWEEMCEVEIPIPDIAVQKAVADLYDVYTERKRINERLKEQIKDICPVLIRGSLQDGGESCG